jgi:hypothetical protein
MKRTSKFLFIYLFFAIVLITISYFNTTGPEHKMQMIELNSLDYIDGFHIFVQNSVQIIFWYLFSPFGISLAFIGKFIYSMGQAPHVVGISPTLYYSSSITHGLGELIVSFFVLLFTVQQLYCFYLFFKHKETTQLKLLYKKLLKNYLPLSILILFISAILEVYVSNRIVISFNALDIIVWRLFL